MSGTVFDIRSGEPIAGAQNFTETPEQKITRLVLAQMRGKVRGEVMSVAILRAKRILRDEPHTTIGKAVQRGVVFAICEEDGTNPPPSAA